MVEESGGLLLNLVESDSVFKSTSIPEHDKKIGNSDLPSLKCASPEAKHTKKSSFQSTEKEQSKFSKQREDPRPLLSSSIFKFNPDIPELSVTKQKSVSEPLFSSKTFEVLELHPHLVSCLKSRLEVVRLTKVQEETIPVLLQGRDSLVKSCTGSGKTLAYAVPIVQKLQAIEPKVKRSDGVLSLVIVPTRELALQSFECFSTLTKAFAWVVPGYLIGGEKKKSEKARLRKGVNVLVCTPGRLLDHLEHTECLSLDKVQWLVIDEADKLMEQGFEESVRKIISKCNEKRQSVLLSATLTAGVQNLAGISLSNPVHIDIASTSDMEVDTFEEFSLPSNLKQFIVVVPAKLRLAVLSSFIIEHCLKYDFKGLIFMNTQSCVDFHYALLRSVLVPLLDETGCKCKIFKLHGSMTQEERTAIFHEFKSVQGGILLCTDVAARGLNLQHIDWILQYSAPESTEIYVHRVGRTARIGEKGQSLLFLLPSETRFSSLLSEHKIQFEQITHEKILESLLQVPSLLMHRKKFAAEDCASALQTQYEDKVYADDELHESAINGFRSFVQGYATYPKQVRHIFPFKSLHLGHVAKSFCLREAPSALGISMPSSHKSKKRKLSPGRKEPSLGRKRPAISEFDSGLPPKKKAKMSVKKRKGKIAKRSFKTKYRVKF